MHQFLRLVQSGKGTHKLARLFFGLCPAGTADAVKLDQIDTTFAEFVFGDKGMFTSETLAQFSLGEIGAFTQRLEGMADEFALHTMDCFLHAPILGAHTLVPKNGS